VKVYFTAENVKVAEKKLAGEKLERREVEKL